MTIDHEDGCKEHIDQEHLDINELINILIDHGCPASLIIEAMIQYVDDKTNDHPDKTNFQLLEYWYILDFGAER